MDLGEAHGLLLRRLPQVVPAVSVAVVDALVAGVAVGIAALDVGGVGQDLLVVVMALLRLPRRAGDGWVVLAV